MFSGVTRLSMKVDAALDPGSERHLVWSEIHDGDALRVDVDEAQQNGERASRDSPETNEHNPVRKGQHPVSLPGPCYS